MQDDSPIQPIEHAQIKCMTCGYDLSGSAVGGVCPECSTPVKESIRVSQGSGSGGNSNTALICMILGICSIAACGFVGPFAIWLYYKAQDEVRRGEADPSSMGMAKAGLITGIIGFVLMFCFCGFGILMGMLDA